MTKKRKTQSRSPRPKRTITISSPDQNRKLDESEHARSQIIEMAQKSYETNPQASLFILAGLQAKPTFAQLAINDLGPTNSAAWDTPSDPAALVSYLEDFNTTKDALFVLAMSAADERLAEAVKEELWAFGVMTVDGTVYGFSQHGDFVAPSTTALEAWGIPT